MSCDHKFVDSPRCLKCGWQPSTMLGHPLTKRGTILGGRLDCYVRLCDGKPLLAAGRVAPLEDRKLVDLVFGRCYPLSLDDGTRVVFSDEFVDKLIDFWQCPDVSKETRQLARDWTILLGAAGLFASAPGEPA